MTPSIPKLVNDDRIEVVASGSLPEWFTVNRAHGHTRLKLADWGNTSEFSEAAAGFRRIYLI